MQLIYVQGKACHTMGEAAAEATRLSGEDAAIWQIGHALMWKKGYVNGIPVTSRIIDEPEAAAAGPPDADDGPAPEKPARRRPLLQIDKSKAFAPKWR
jgi:hypothetical protein